MKENRKFRRVNLAEHPEVFDAQSNELLGRIVDISTGGFKMVAFSEMEEGKEYLLNIVLPEKNNEKKCIEVKASIRWCSKDIDPELITSGCHLVQIDALGRLNLSNIMLNAPEQPNEDI
jgi:c-di-GMP-binding flagellar brake protein YcgR